MRGHKLLCYGSATSTGIAGILHLMIALDVLGFSMNFAIFFVIAGAAQLFYIVPMLRTWGRPWYYIGIMWTAVLIIMWIGSRVPSEFSDPLRIELRSIMVQVFQFAFLLFTIRILQTLTMPFRDSARDAGYSIAAASRWL